MKQAIILAAGRGTRLGEAAQGKPKCLLPVGDISLLEHQLQALHQLGIQQICVVVGYRDQQIRSLIGDTCTYIFNPDYQETNSLYSLWLARRWVSGPFILLNGDVLAHPLIFREVITTKGSALAYDSSSGGEEEHMKIYAEHSFLKAISKELPKDKVIGENVGILQFDHTAGEILFEEAHRLITTGGEMLWAPAAVDRTAARAPIKSLDIAGLPWTEIDFPEDLQHARTCIWPCICNQSTTKLKGRA